MPRLIYLKRNRCLSLSDLILYLTPSPSLQGEGEGGEAAKCILAMNEQLTIKRTTGRDPDFEF
jgi:hypothetical protein